MANKNLMMVNGKSADNEDAYLTINLADDNKEVRGFGKPVTREKAKDMAESFFTACESGWKLIMEINANPAYAELKNSPGFAPLKDLIDPENQTVSGVFGKEIILQILSMRNCEGLRYIYGKDGGKNTVILIGVTDSGSFTQRNGTTKATSTPVKVPSVDASDMPLDGEVHDDSMTIGQVRNMLTNHSITGNTPIDILFGEY